MESALKITLPNQIHKQNEQLIIDLKQKIVEMQKAAVDLVSETEGRVAAAATQAQKQIQENNTSLNQKEAALKL